MEEGHLLPRYRVAERQAMLREQQRVLEQALLDSGRSFQAGMSGDKRQLRGVPVQTRGVSGTMPGTDPSAVAE